MHKPRITIIAAGLMIVSTIISSSFSFSHDKDQALIEAVRKGDFKQVQELLDKGADVDAKTDALMRAFLSGRAEVAKLLLEKGAQFDAKGQNALTALCTAAIHGDLEMVKLLLAKGVDANAGHGRALINAAYYGNAQVVKLLLDGGADVNAKDDSNTTALMNAAGKGRLQITNLLLHKGADVNARDNSGTTALIYAVGVHFELLNMLRDKGADNPNVTAFMNMVVKRPLPKDTIGTDRLKIVSLLLDKGAEVNVRDKWGRTGLKFAQERDDAQIVELLKAHGARE